MMNHPELNKLQLKNLADMASTNWANVPHYAAVQAIKMKAALEMVLLFHTAGRWTSELSLQWHNLQGEAGREFSSQAVTTKVICDTIQEVLGLQQEKMEAIQ
jgi:hypothetical protein